MERTEAEFDDALRVALSRRVPGYDPDIELIARSILPSSEVSDLDQARDVATRRPDLLDVVLAVNSDQECELRPGAPPPSRDVRSGWFGKGGRRRILSYAAAMAAGAIFATLSPVGSPSFRGPLSTENASLTHKGEVDRIALLVERGDVQFALPSGGALRSGDRLGLFYSSAHDGYLAVLHRDAQGDCVPLYPALDGASGPIVAAELRSLPDGAEVDDGGGCQWFVGVFSRAAIALPALCKSVASATADTAACHLDLTLADIPGADTIDIFDVGRPGP